jgi:hypothetical protein
VNEDELIHRIAHRMDPLVFEHQGSQPPSGFFGSPEWWATAKHSRRKRTTEAAAAAVEALRTLGFAVVPRDPTTAMMQAGAERLAGEDVSAVNRERCVLEIWETMLAGAERQDDDARGAAPRGALEAFPAVIRRGA